MYQDTFILVQTLQQAISPDENERKVAEFTLKGLRQNPKLPATLIQIFTDQSQQPECRDLYQQIKLLAAIYLTNILRKNQLQLNEQQNQNDKLETVMLSEKAEKKSININKKQESDIFFAYMHEYDKTLRKQMLEIMKYLSIRDMPYSFAEYQDFFIQHFKTQQQQEQQQQQQQNQQLQQQTLQLQNGGEYLFEIQYVIFKNMYKTVFKKMNLNNETLRNQCLRYYEEVNHYLYQYIDQQYEILVNFNTKQQQSRIQENPNGTFQFSQQQQQQQQQIQNDNEMDCINEQQQIQQSPVQFPQKMIYCLKSLNLENQFSCGFEINSERCIKLLIEFHELYYSYQNQISHLLQLIAQYYQNMGNYHYTNGNGINIQNVEQQKENVKYKIQSMYFTGQYIYYMQKYFMQAIKQLRVNQKQGIDILDYLKMYYFYNIEVKTQQIKNSLQTDWIKQILNTDQIWKQLQQFELLEIQSITLCKMIYSYLGSLVNKDLFNTNADLIQPSYAHQQQQNYDNLDQMQENQIKNYFNEDFVQTLCEYLIKKIIQKDQWAQNQNLIVNEPETYFNEHHISSNQINFIQDYKYNLRYSSLSLLKTLYTLVNRSKVESILARAYQQIYNKPLKQEDIVQETLIDLQQREGLYFIFAGLFLYIKNGINFDQWFDNCLKTELSQVQNANFYQLHVGIFNIIYQQLLQETDSNTIYGRNTLKLSGFSNSACLQGILDISTQFLENKHLNMCLRLQAYRCCFKIMEIQFMQYNLQIMDQDQSQQQQFQESLQNYLTEQFMTSQLKKYLQIMFELLNDVDDIQTKLYVLDFLRESLRNQQKMICIKFSEPIFQFLQYIFNDLKKQQNKHQEDVGSMYHKIADIFIHLTKFQEKILPEQLVFYHEMICQFLVIKDTGSDPHLFSYNLKEDTKDLFQIETGFNVLYQVFNQVNRQQYTKDGNNNLQFQLVNETDYNEKLQQFIKSSKHISNLVFGNQELFQLSILIGVELLHLYKCQEIYNSSFQLIIVLLHKFYRNTLVNYEYVFDFLELYIIQIGLTDPLFDISIEGIVIGLQSKIRLLKTEIEELKAQNDPYFDDKIDNLQTLYQAVQIGILRTLSRLILIKENLFIKLILRLQKNCFSGSRLQFKTFSQYRTDKFVDFFYNVIFENNTIINSNKKYSGYKKQLFILSIRYLKLLKEQLIEKEQQLLIDSFQKKIDILDQNTNFNENNNQNGEESDVSSQQIYLEKQKKDEIQQYKDLEKQFDENIGINETQDTVLQQQDNTQNNNQQQQNMGIKEKLEQQFQQQGQGVDQQGQRVENLAYLTVNLLVQLKQEEAKRNGFGGIQGSGILYRNVQKLIYSNEQHNTNIFGVKGMFFDHIEKTVSDNDPQLSKWVEEFKQWCIQNEGGLSDNIKVMIQQNQLFQ